MLCIKASQTLPYVTRAYADWMGGAAGRCRAGKQSYIVQVGLAMLMAGVPFSPLQVNESSRIILKLSI